MNDEHKEKIYYIQQQADELSTEISKLMRRDADLSEKPENEILNGMLNVCFPLLRIIIISAYMILSRYKLVR